jgi:hypothetical protein
MRLTLLTNTPMKRARTALLAGVLVISTSCQDFLDVNQNPNGPEVVTANLYLPPMLHAMVTTQPFDGRFIGDFVQNWYRPGTSFNTWDRMGYDRGSDNGGQTWREVYWTFGQNLIDMNIKAEAEQRWDLLGVGIMMKGWGWMTLASLHGDLIVSQAFDQTRFSFDYDSEEDALIEARKLLDSAIVLLQRTDGAVDAAYLGKTDKIYNGDRVKWLKFTYGLRALLQNRYSNKATYDAAAVIADVDASFTNNTDDALLPYPGTQAVTDDRNLWGPSRSAAAQGNLGAYRQTRFIVELMNGTQFGGAVDPRLTRMLAASPDTATNPACPSTNRIPCYRGLDINTLNYGALTTAQRPNNLWGATANLPAGTPTRYIFSDKTKFPAMTYAQLQFVKAEAAFRQGDRPTALTAYTNGISYHIDFVNARNLDDAQVATQITAAEKTAFLANANIVPTAANLTMTHIMSQKYIAQFAWGFFEQWMDMRRFHYTDTYAGETRQVFPGFVVPTNLDADNQGQPAYRLRPRYNSEYVWNQQGLNKITPIKGTEAHYQTSQLWIIQP